MKKLGALLLIAGSTLGCSKASDHAEQLHTTRDRQLSLGLVQKEIYKGMTQADVATVLGSPNIVSKDTDERQAWIYDKIATEVSYSQDEGGVWLLLGGYGKASGAKGTSQKTLTIVIKFDEEQQVDSVSYHSSQF